MSRAAKKAFEQQQGQSAQFASGVEGAANATNKLAAGLSPTVTPQESADVMRASTGATDVAAKTAEDKAANFAARTGAIAGAPELQAELERSRGRDVADAQMKARLGLMNLPFQRAGEIGSLYGNVGQQYGSLYAPSTQLTGRLSDQAFAPGLLSQMLVAAAKGAGQGATGAL